MTSKTNNLPRPAWLKEKEVEPERESPLIGIDLGTSTSAIAVLVDGVPHLIPDVHGDTVIPSVVQLTADGDYVVGTPAKTSAVAFPDRTVLEVKRMMGSGEGVRLGEKTLTPEAVSAVILSHLKAAAEAYTGGPIKDVVLSVPARFENDAREATRRAAEMAGLNVVRLINEPTAAALSYGLNQLKEKQKVLVFDFGGGTLDVTLLEMFQGVLDVKTSVGDDRLGGKDVDEALTQILRDAYRDQTGKKLPPPSRDRKLAQVLREEAEKYKKQLSSSLNVEVSLPDLTPDGGITLTLSRETLEERIDEMVMRAMMLVNEALSRARLRWSEIDVVLPIGGSSRIPIFRRAVEMAWGHASRDVEYPEEAVARGAAIAAGIERGVYAAGGDTDASLVILDVSPHRLGVATIKQVGADQYVNDYFSEIIPKDAKLPAVQTRRYNTLFNGQEPISIRIFEATGESNLCRDHHLVSELPLRSLSEGSEGEEVQVEFRYTLDGTLDVTVGYISVPAIRTQGRYLVTGGGGGSNGSDSPRAPLHARWQDSPQADLCTPLLEQAERWEQSNPDAAQSGGLSQAAQEVKAALMAGDEVEVRRRLDLLTDLLFEMA